MGPREVEIGLLPESSSPSSDTHTKSKAIAIVDPLSSGALLAQVCVCVCVCVLDFTTMCVCV